MNAKADESGNDVNDKSARYTVESLQFTATQLERVLTDLRTSIGLLGSAKLKTIEIPYGESSRRNGLARLKSWTDTLRDAVDKAADLAFQAVSESPAEDEKQRKKK
jgi:hypothetical protein